MTQKRKTVYDKLEQKVMDSPKISEKDKKELLRAIAEAKNEKLNILITGPTGCGKSSTINALFETEVAKVGVGVDPETMDIEKYDLGNMVLWDSPGLGDGKEADNRHAKNIIAKLYEKDENGKALIDLVLVILDGSSRDLGTSYQLINEVIIPNLGPNAQDRILVAINQADVAMKGRFWDYEANKPLPKLESFLKEKAASVKKRILEATGVEIEPIYYSAGFKEPGEPQQPPYNLSKLLYYIVKATPESKRGIYADKVNHNPEMWKDDDGIRQYREETRKSVAQSVVNTIRNTYAGYKAGAAIGGAIAGPIGAAIGGAIGGTVAFVSSLFDW